MLRCRRTVLMPIIFLLCTVGAFATASRLFDVYAMLVIGIGAFFLRRRGYQMAPFVLGLVLGPLLDKSLRRGLVLSDGSLAPFFTRPISLAFAVVTIFAILLYVPAFKAAVKRVTGGAGSGVRARCSAGAPERRDDEARALQRSARADAARGAVRARRGLGYDGLEIAPFTLAEGRERIDAARGAADRAASSSDAACVVTGLHWLLVKPSGLSITDPDAARARRARSRSMQRLIDLCAELGGKVPGARLAEAARGRRRRDAARRRWRARWTTFSPRWPSVARGARRHLLHRAAVARRDGARSTPSPRRPRSCARSIARPADDDRLQRRRPTETESVAELIDRWMPTGLIAHVQVNDPNRRGPARARCASRRSSRRCKRHGYDGNVAVEPFDYVPDGPGCAAFAAGYLRGVREVARLSLIYFRKQPRWPPNDSESSCTASPDAWA